MRKYGIYMREIEKQTKNAQDKKACSFIRKYLRVIMTRLFLKKFSFETPFSWFSYLLSTGQINNIYDNKTTYSGVYTVGVLNVIPFRFPKYNTKFGLHHPCTTRDDSHSILGQYVLSDPYVVVHLFS